MEDISQTAWTLLAIILDLHVGHVSGEVQKNILSILLWAPAVVGEQHCLVIPERLVASQELFLFKHCCADKIHSHYTLHEKNLHEHMNHQ